MKTTISTNAFYLFKILGYAISLTILLFTLFMVSATGQLPLLIAMGLTFFFFFYAGWVLAGIRMRKASVPHGEEVTHEQIAPYLRSYNEVLQHVLAHAHTVEAFYYSVQVLEGSTYNFWRGINQGYLPALPPDEHMKFQKSLVDKYLVTPAATAPSEIVTKG